MLSWVALDIYPARLALMHNRSLCKLEMLLRSWEERNMDVALMGLGILVELGVHLMKEKRVVLRQPFHPWLPF